jgi:hypothetical protein
MDIEDVQDVLFELIDTLDRLKITYAVMGGLAVRFYAMPRPTQDVDINLGVTPDDSIALLKNLDEAGFDVPEAYAAGWSDRVAAMPLVKVKRFLGHRNIDVDLFLTGSAFQRSLMSRRIQVPYEGRNIWLVSPEDLVLLKITADRPRDRIDVQDLFFALGDLDDAYLDHWAEKLAVTDKLAAARKEFRGETS